MSSATRSPLPRRWVRSCLIATGIAAVAGAVLHLAIPFGGPDWYAFFGAPHGIVELARRGHPRPPITCVAIAGLLSVIAAYAFSGAGWIRRLPMLRVVLGAAGIALIARGLLFVPLILWRPDALARICDCRSIDAFILLTSALCLAMGAGLALGAIKPSQSDS